MKYLVLIAVVGVVLWLLRSRARTVKPAPPRPTPTPQAMVSCAHCGVHLPRAEALAGPQGSYCSEAHRLAHGDPR